MLLQIGTKVASKVRAPPVRPTETESLLARAGLYATSANVEDLRTCEPRYCGMRIWGSRLPFGLMT